MSQRCTIWDAQERFNILVDAVYAAGLDTDGWERCMNLIRRGWAAYVTAWEAGESC